MTTLNAPTLKDVQYSGDCPLAPAHGKIALAAAQIADKARLVLLYAGTKVHHARMINAALGASTTVSLGFEYADGSAGGDPNAFFNAQATATAGSNISASSPVVLLRDAYIIATVGGAAATGNLEAVLLHEFRGI